MRLILLLAKGHLSNDRISWRKGCPYQRGTPVSIYTSLKLKLFNILGYVARPMYTSAMSQTGKVSSPSNLAKYSKHSLNIQVTNIINIQNSKISIEGPPRCK